MVFWENQHGEEHNLKRSYKKINCMMKNNIRFNLIISIKNWTASTRFFRSSSVGCSLVQNWTLLLVYVKFNFYYRLIWKQLIMLQILYKAELYY